MPSHLRVLPVLGVSCLFLAALPVARAQLIEQAKLFSTAGGVGFSSLGGAAAVSADGNTAIVGGANDSSYAGAAWIFTRTNGLWNQQSTRLVGSGAVGAAEQGLSVAISADGNTAIIGGPFDNNGTGAAWIVTRANGAWSQQGAKLVGGGAAGLAIQGASVAMSADGNTAAVGGPLDNFGAGAVWIFTRSNGAWSQQGGKLTGSDAAGLAGFGSAVAAAADGNTVVVGGPGDSNNAGATWVFTRTGAAWSQQGSKLIGAGAAKPAAQGSAVAISTDGNTILAGGPADTNGAVWVFTRTGGVWSQQGTKLTATGTIGATRQGWLALSGNGNTAIVGAPAAATPVAGEPASDNSGETFVFTRAGGVWTLGSSPLIGTSVLGSAAQGTSVSITADASTVVVGGPDDESGLGAVWVFGPKGVPAATGVVPASGSGSAQTFTFTFSDTAGSSKLAVLNVLINNVLDGRQACYLAFVPTSATAGFLNLVDNAGDAGGPFTQTYLSPNSSFTGIVQNGQCTVTGAGSSYSTSGNTATLTLAAAFAPSFAGNKVVYLAARQADVSSSWQALGTWNIPGPAILGPTVPGMSPASSSGLSQSYTFTFTDSNGWQDIGIANILINSALDGRHACYLAYVPAGAGTGMLHLLVDNPVDAGGPFTNLALPGSGTVSNSQCTVSGTGASATAAGNTLTLTLPITFSQSFAGNLIFYLAARNNTLNSGWQAMGTVAVP